MSTDLPTEMWAYIFSFACMDDGQTGCALQRVSKHFRELSKPFRFTSICLYGSEEILQFEAAITPLPPNERRVRYLHITTPHLLLDVSKDEDDDDYDEIEGSGDEENAENMETDSSKSDLDEEEYQPLSVAEESELQDDKIYLISSFYEGLLQVDRDEETKQANNVILLSVNHIISTVSSTLYALSIHWAKESDSAWYFSIPDFIPSSTSLPCLTELYLCIDLHSYTPDASDLDTYPKSRFHRTDLFLKKFKGLTLPALRRLRFAGLAWSAVECPYDMVKRMAPNLTHIRTKTDLMRGALGPFTFPANLKVLIEVPDRTLDGEDVESLMNDRDFVRSMGYDPHHVTVIGMRITEAYDADCWEAHWAAGLQGESGHWPEPGDLILSPRE